MKKIDFALVGGVLATVVVALGCSSPPSALERPSKPGTPIPNRISEISIEQTISAVAEIPVGDRYRCEVKELLQDQLALEYHLEPPAVDDEKVGLKVGFELKVNVTAAGLKQDGPDDRDDACSFTLTASLLFRRINRNGKIDIIATKRADTIETKSSFDGKHIPNAVLVAYRHLGVEIARFLTEDPDVIKALKEAEPNKP